ncbi:DUF4105 domain-containing protein [Psychrosphaera sp. B3R10]|uniref:Lnb N-terminal periplasmic domain-containing protein n=1 Tax=unclassified Psychrosphaera TaxID=2641570 RepID=UPI001C09706E|nr:MULTISPECIES: DUF4105 domain-containing protein [unclassified Psychrosphaera]MBU2883887.1 DUF4105 domain-containing protein [Psychrosphaera sp. I2R16]MBU2988750.1 DUF4105 domain-containing protein [Psychrosphaera sp. B3R10]
MRFILFLFFFLCIQAFASPIPKSNTEISARPSEEIQSLANDPFWIGLLRYKNNDGLFQSEVTSDSYFLSDNGKTDSSAELLANIKLLFSTPTDNNHPSCRFPARFSWLSKQLNLNTSQYNLNHCEDFNQWAKLPSLKSASLVYASGYLGNPASFFGHLLLKFNYQSNSTGSNLLLDHSVNFGAAIPPEDGALTYVFKGFFGGYFAAFKEDSFFRHHKMYAEQESRDLWDYQLALSNTQLQMLIMHVWELRRQKFDYYYLNDNCASRIAELISIITDRKLIDDEFYWAQPINVFKAIATPSNNLIASIDKHQSKFSSFLSNYQHLTATEKEVVVKLNSQWRTNSLLNNTDNSHNAYTSLSLAEKVNVINTLIEFLNYQHQLGKTDNSFRKKLLKERLLLPTGGNFKPTKIETAPHLGQQPSMTQITVRHSSSGQLATKIRMRATYYDLLSNDIGRLANSSLQMGDLEFLVSDEGVRLERFDITNILTLQPAQTDLNETSNLAWKIRLGFESNQQKCFECINATTELGLGKAYAFGGGTVYGMPELKLQTSTSYLRPISASLTLGYLWDFNSYWKSHIELNQPIIGLADTSYDNVPTLKWQNRFGLGIDYDVRFSIERRPFENSIDLSYSYYWQ